MRVLFSFPHRIGAGRICYTAWQQVRGLCGAGVEVVLYTGAVSRPLPDEVQVHTTLARGKLRLPYKLVGNLRALTLHDKIVAHNLPKFAGKVDVVHVWPSAALETIKAAKRLGIPTVLERPNAHTRFCYDVVAAEHRRIGIQTPHFDYKGDTRVLAREEAEFDATDFLLCPSEFAANSFRDFGFPDAKILRHQYGFDETEFFPATEPREPGTPFTALFVGVDAVRKGLHLALEAWISSPAAATGTFLIAGELSGEFKQRFATLLSHPSIKQLGHRRDVPRLMRSADILLLPSFEEGSALVCAEAIASGCVPLASTACTEMCQHMDNALIHRVGDVQTLHQQICDLYRDPQLLARLRAGSLKSRGDWTWERAGAVLAKAYEHAVSHREALTCASSRQ
ncbi:MAG TPA: glycosyltransferase family 4 protein [Terracidiphilus sp.]|nr:glycosyltransferase family 4 protein [Terracidiphilus sp.]